MLSIRANPKKSTIFIGQYTLKHEIGSIYYSRKSLSVEKLGFPSITLNCVQADVA